MHKLLENSLCSQAQSRLAEDEVDSLRALTERQDRQIDDLMKEMDAIVTEVCPFFSMLLYNYNTEQEIDFIQQIGVRRRKKF